MLALNATSKSAQVAAISEGPALVPASAGITSQVSAMGVASLRFIAARTGISYETVSVWIPFAILPALVVLLVCVNISQSFKIRKLEASRSHRHT